MASKPMPSRPMESAVSTPSASGAGPTVLEGGSGARATVVIAGAAGFVGTALARALGHTHRVIGLSRASRRVEPGSGIDSWRACDLFSLMDAEKALEGADVAYFLVHSMMPSARLTQGRFEDLDLIAADNFARAAARCGVKQILYLGGLAPENGPLSPHLMSRIEVEKTLGAYGVPVTALRAGLIMGGEGSSFQILLRLVERLPVMLCPAWTATPTQPIFIDDVVALLSYCLLRPSTYAQVYDIGGPEVPTYQGLMATLAEQLGLKRRMLPVPLFSPGLSRLWLSLITGAPDALVAPLVQSLRHPMVARDRRLQEMAGIPGVPLEEALRRAVQASRAHEGDSPLAFQAPKKGNNDKDVRSVQRLVLPRGRTAAWAADAYMNWLPTGMPPVRVVRDGDTCSFTLGSLPQPLLVLERSERSTPDRALFYIRGGLLARIQGRGRLEFRESWDHQFLLAAIHEYRPALPWPVYMSTQAQVHLHVMSRFGRYLERFAREEALTSRD